jgi:hypothetical protein
VPHLSARKAGAHAVVDPGAECDDRCAAAVDGDVERVGLGVLGFACQAADEHDRAGGEVTRRYSISQTTIRAVNGVIGS